MDRRKFIKQLGAAGAAPILLNGLPINALAANSPLMKMLADSNSDRVLIFLQMHGGNDGLNTIIPIKNYSEYQFARANIAVPDDGARKYIALDDTLPEDDQIGLHPDMQGVKDLYDEKSAAVVQAVGYENMNMSHFRSRDIWFTGSDSDEKLSSGWMGRFLEQEYPGYPDGYPNDDMPDPLGLEIGNEVTLAFQQANNIPAGISLANPDSFYNLIEGIGVNPPQEFPDSYYGDELEYLMKFEIKTNDYAERLKQVWDAGSNSSVVYPSVYPHPAPIPYINNPLAEQFKIIARLLSGGIKTRIFMTRIGGFDTHANQVEEAPSNISYGRHAALLYHISETVKAFHNDLKEMGNGLEDKVLTMTFSEFGRRIYSNDSFGTDHGRAAPVLLFGNGLKGGVIGTNPDLSQSNVEYQIDYRRLYTTVLSDWLGSPDSSITDTGFGEFLSQKLDLIESPSAVNDITEYKGKNKLNSCYPNPAKDYTKMSYYIHESAKVNIRLYTSSGKLVRVLVNESQNKGNYEVDVNLSGLRTGNYLYRMDTGNFKSTKILLIT